MATEEKIVDTKVDVGPEGKELFTSEKGEEKPADFTSLQKLIVSQNELLLSLTKKIDSLETRQDVSDSAIIEVAKKVGSGGGGILAQIIPFLRQSGPGPLETIAMKMFLRNIAFSTLTTERLAKSQFGDEYEKMVKDMEAELSGGKPK